MEQVERGTAETACVTLLLALGPHVFTWIVCVCGCVLRRSWTRSCGEGRRAVALDAVVHLQRQHPDAHRLLLGVGNYANVAEVGLCSVRMTCECALSLATLHTAT
eukprot:Opistho-2@23480